MVIFSVQIFACLIDLRKDRMFKLYYYSGLAFRKTFEWGRGVDKEIYRQIWSKIVNHSIQILQ